METIYSAVTHTYNIVHNNGVQTSVKLSPSGEFTEESMERTSPVTTDKNKYTVIISSSKGCQMSCSFCHLTKLGKPFHRLTEEEIVDNVMEALSVVPKTILSSKYIKLCYMGEGEAILDVNKTIVSATRILDRVLEEGLAIGIDGIDISTSMPKVSNKALGAIVDANNNLKGRYSLNPFNHQFEGRSVIRVFYSMHHYNDISRQLIIPNTKDILPTLIDLSNIQAEGVNVVVHYMFMEGVNTSAVDILGLTTYINSYDCFKNFEFRVLRYNGFSSEDKEASDLEGITNHLRNNLQVGKFKVQYSAGEEIKAACGMFIK